MLRPRKHPLIDQPLVATATGTLQRTQWTVRITVLALLALCGTWLWAAHNSQDEIYAEAWWRSLITTLINRQFQDSVSEAKDSRLSERVKTYESERAEMQARLKTLDKLVQSAKVDGWLRQLSVMRETDSEISYEILLANPQPNADPTTSGSKGSHNIVVLVRGIDRFDPAAPEIGVTQSALRFTTVKHELAAPNVAEVLRGKVSSKAAKFLIATVIPFDNSAMTEVRVIPVGIPSRSP